MTTRLVEQTLVKAYPSSGPIIMLAIGEAGLQRHHHQITHQADGRRGKCASAGSSSFTFLSSFFMCSSRSPALHGTDRFKIFVKFLPIRVTQRMFKRTRILEYQVGDIAIGL